MSMSHVKCTISNAGFVRFQILKRGCHIPDIAPGIGNSAAAIATQKVERPPARRPFCYAGTSASILACGRCAEANADKCEPRAKRQEARRLRYQSGAEGCRVSRIRICGEREIAATRVNDEALRIANASWARRNRADR